MTVPSFTILYSDDHLFAISKPAWWAVHRGMAKDTHVIVDALKIQLQQDRVYPLHRLDRQTSGVLLFARTGEIARLMQQQFDSKTLHKEYIALIRGVCPKQGLIDAPVPKCEGGARVPAQTEFSRIDTVETYPRAVSLVRAIPLTGRFHQIRRHLKHISHPIIGDANYGKGDLNRAFKEKYGLARMALHAQNVSFTHPATQKQVTIHAPLTDDLLEPLRQMGLGNMMDSPE